MNSACAHVHITGQDRTTYELIYQFTCMHLADAFIQKCTCVH